MSKIQTNTTNKHLNKKREQTNKHRRCKSSQVMDSNEIKKSCQIQILTIKKSCQRQIYTNLKRQIIVKDQYKYRWTAPARGPCLPNNTKTSSPLRKLQVKHTGCTKKMQHSDLWLKSVPALSLPIYPLDSPKNRFEPPRPPQITQMA